MRRNKRSKTVLIAGLFLIVSAHSFAGTDSLHQQESAQSKAANRIVGKVQIEGLYKRPVPLKVYKNRDFCGAEVPNETLLVGAEGVLRNAVIILHGTQNKKTMRPLKSLVLDNKNCAFVPHVQVAPVGSEVLLLNGDPILHDVHARIGSETLFNVGLPAWRKVTKRLTRTGVVNIVCEVLHTWMSAYIVVTSSPYFAVTDEKGEFVIEGVPAGAHKIEVWHEKLGGQSRRVTVVGGSTFRADFGYRLDKRGT